MSVERLTMIDGIGNDELVRCMGCGLEKAGENLENCGFCEEGWQKALKNWPPMRIPVWSQKTF